MKTTLVVMAAGMGSRFGGLKQATAVIDDGRGILDLSVYDAKCAGFDDVLFIIRDEIEDDFKRVIGDRISKSIPVSYIKQDQSLLPEGRVKPFGTGHAILCCKDVVKNPFAIINADDYYGKDCFKLIHDHLVSHKENQFCMVSYLLSKTVSTNGSVNRGVCKVSDGYLTGIHETLSIQPDLSYVEDGKKYQLTENTPVSMNIWGVTPLLFKKLNDDFNKFLEKSNLQKDELFLHDSIFEMIEDNLASVRVYSSTDKWYGITYREDLPEVKKALNKYVEEGKYPKISN